MIAALIIIGYLLTCLGSFFIWVYDLRRERDVIINDIMMLVIISLLGPCSFIAAVIILMTDTNNGERVIWKKHASRVEKE